MPITPYAADSVNYTQTAAQPTCYPITPILADTAHPGDEIKIITVRQVNTPHSENLEVFRREVDGPWLSLHAGGPDHTGKPAA